MHPKILRKIAVCDSICSKIGSAFGAAVPTRVGTLNIFRVRALQKKELETATNFKFTQCIGSWMLALTDAGVGQSLSHGLTGQNNSKLPSTWVVRAVPGWLIREIDIVLRFRDTHIIFMDRI